MNIFIIYIIKNFNLKLVIKFRIIIILLLKFDKSKFLNLSNKVFFNN